MTSTPRPYVAARIAHTQRLARASSCPRCRAGTLVGPSHDDVAMVVTVDAEPISPLLEPQCVEAGLATFDLDKGKLCYREPWHRASEWPKPLPVHVEHTCR